jgi:ubiquinone/menaquinone biosynthesis C-methylase UbiE
MGVCNIKYSTIAKYIDIIKMKVNKNHWYDGWFYDKIIAPNQDRLFGQIKKYIDADSALIDVGCGTGRLAFSFADKCKSVLGIDLSKRNIDRANRTLSKRYRSNISFFHGNVNELNHNGQSQFDYAILTYVIHEVNEDERIKLLNDLARIADKIIIGDYVVPRPEGFQGTLSKVIEFIAGKEHYRNYNSYMTNGGISYLANKAGLKIIKEINDQQSTNHIVVLTK